MTASGALALAFLPLLFWAVSGLALGFVTLRRTPAVLAAGILAGLGAVACAVSVQVLFDRFVPLEIFPLSAFLPALLVALSEEGARTVAVGTARRFSTDGQDDAEAERRGLLWFGLLVGLSFFAFESLWYALRTPESLVLRLAWTLPLHGAAGVLVADRFAARPRPSFRGIVLAVIFHALWDFCMDPVRSSSRGFLFLALLTLLGAVFAAFLLWNAPSEPA